jgi:PKD repeat protein
MAKLSFAWHINKKDMRRSVHLYFILSVLIFSGKLAAQAFSFSISPGSQCYSAGNNTATAFVTSPAPSATDYSWTITTPTSGCNSSITGLGNGTVATISFSCCGVYTITCAAWNNTLSTPALVSTISSTTAIFCPFPFITAFSNAGSGVCQGASVILSASGAVSYTWSNGSTTPSTSILASTTVPCYTVFGTNSFGCNSSALVCFSVFPNPVASIIYSPGASGVMNFTSSSTNLNSPLYQWGFPGGNPLTATNQAVSTTYTSNGVYNASLQVTNSTGCWDSTMVTYTVNSVGSSTGCPVIANFTYTQTANGQVNFTNLSTGTTSFSTFNWNFGTGSNSSAFSPTFNYPNNGTYTVSLTTQNSFSCSNTHTAIITITTHSIPACNAQFTANVAAGNVTVTSLSTGVNVGTSYTWSFVASSSTTGVNMTQAYKTYTSSGTKYIQLTINNPTIGCNDSYTDSISVNIPLPCSVSVIYTPPTNSATCNGSATVASVAGMCAGALSYTWVPTLTSGPVAANLCNGNYTVYVSSSGSGTSCCSTAVGTVNVVSCNLTAGFTSTATGPGSFGFISTSSGTTAGTTYSWNFGDGSSAGSGASATHTYAAGGTYTVTLTVSNGSTCSSSISHTVLSTSCNLTPAFTYSSQTGGWLWFTSVSGGTSTLTTYSWDFGYGFTTPSSSNTMPQPYYVNGTYTVALKVTNSASCTATTVQTVVVTTTANCNVNAGYTYTANGNGNVAFTSTSTGTNALSSYTWNFGDGSPSSIGLNLAQVNHTYASSGNYTVSLQVRSGPTTCTSLTLNLVTATNSLCALAANFTHTVGMNGSVNFANTSVGTNSNTSYTWNFGDGFSTQAMSPSHTYINAGLYYVTLYIADNFNSACADTIIQAINVTGISCIANSNFTLVPTSIPKHWNAIPAYPWNITAATWSWGDGTTTNTLYTSHQYSVSANYNICLSVTVSCGASSSACATYFIYRSTEGAAADILNVNVISPTETMLTSLNENLSDEFTCSIYPNPNDGKFSLRLQGLKELTEINMYDLVGKQIYTERIIPTDDGSDVSIDPGDIPGGIYLVRIVSGDKHITKKIIVER